MQALPGFRDFYPADCAARRYIFEKWREVARRYGFVEVDGPVLEPVELYKKKSGGELMGQLFNFKDKGDREVTLRPEMTPTLARMVAARDREFKKPLKWFSIASFFRYEKQQKGRLREFTQLNCDLVGESSAAADAEMIALAIDLMRTFGFTEHDIGIRLSSRDIWESYLMHTFANRGDGWGPHILEQLLSVVDRMERQTDEASDTQLDSIGLTINAIRSWMAKWTEALRDPEAVSGNTPLAKFHELLHVHLAPRGLLPYIEIDFSIVRGLAYYTGVVFEIFDRARSSRALAGGGRYDNLVGTISDGAVKHPALGFAIGDVTLLNLLHRLPHTDQLLASAAKAATAPELYVVIADEKFRSDALSLIAYLRDENHRIDFALTPQKVTKQLQSAENSGAKRALIIGSEWPQVKVKVLATRSENSMPVNAFVESLQTPPLTL